MSLLLWSGKNCENARTHKILALAALAKVPVELRVCEYGNENETKEYMNNCSPCGRYPSLQTDEGYIFESNAILRHIARLDRSNTYLYGHTPFEASQIDMWMDFAASEFDANVGPFLMHFFMGAALPENALAPVEEALVGLNTWLETRTFLVGERVTVADVAIAFSLQWVYRAIPEGDALSKKYKNAYRLYNTVMYQPAVAAVLAEQGAAIGPIKAAAPAPAKKAEPKKEAKKEAKKEEAMDDEDEPAKEKKKPNPLDFLPPSPFVLDAFKREYSNNDTRTVAAPYFFSHFDPEGFSAFWCTYKYNDENKMQFKTANLVRGWFQRMDHLHKYLFGSVLLVGEPTQHDIVGLWIFRGKGMPEAVKEVEDTELFNWEEIPDVNAQKEKITDYFAWEGPTITRPVLEGRVYK